MTMKRFEGNSSIKPVHMRVSIAKFSRAAIEPWSMSSKSYKSQSPSLRGSVPKDPEGTKVPAEGRSVYAPPISIFFPLTLFHSKKTAPIKAKAAIATETSNVVVMVSLYATWTPA